jgi:hypothetical protein
MKNRWDIGKSRAGTVVRRMLPELKIVGRGNICYIFEKIDFTGLND